MSLTVRVTFLLTSETLEKVDHAQIDMLFENATSFLWPDGIKYENVMLFVFDSAPHMAKAGK